MSKWSPENIRNVSTQEVVDYRAEKKALYSSLDPRTKEGARAYRAAQKAEQELRRRGVQQGVLETNGGDTGKEQVVVLPGTSIPVTVQAVNAKIVDFSLNTEIMFTSSTLPMALKLCLKGKEGDAFKGISPGDTFSLHLSLEKTVVIDLPTVDDEEDDDEEEVRLEELTLK
jgi:hypothetical protein